jgi:hypothetical protein
MDLLAACMESLGGTALAAGSWMVAAAAADGPPEDVDADGPLEGAGAWPYVGGFCDQLRKFCYTALLSHFYVIMAHSVIALLSRSSLICTAPSGHCPLWTLNLQS